MKLLSNEGQPMPNRLRFAAVNALDALTHYVPAWPLVRLYIRALHWSEDRAEAAARRAEGASRG